MSTWTSLLIEFSKVVLCWSLVFFGLVMVFSSMQIAAGISVTLLGFLNLVNFFQHQ